MKSVRLFSLVLLAVCCWPVVASAQMVVLDRVMLPERAMPINGPGGLFGRPMVWREGTVVRPGQRLRVKRARPKPVWKIPQGKYGLQIKDGLRMIGRPAKNWSATLKTGFGTVTIPLAQITKLEPTANGQFAAHLKNGDRVTGELISKKLPFETEFGTLNVPSSDLVRLSTATPVTPTVPKSTGGRGKTNDPQPPPPVFRGDLPGFGPFKR